MKTQIYFPQAEFKATALTMVLSVAFLFSLKAQEQPTQMVPDSYKLGVFLSNNSLVGTNNDSVAETGNAKLAQELKLMMSSGSYWSNEEGDERENLREILAQWMKNGLYWKENQTNTDDVINAEPIAVNQGE